MQKELSPTRIIVDDLRNHSGGGLHLRTSADAVAWFSANPHHQLSELWLDHDLGGDDTIRPLVLYLEERCANDNPAPIICIYVHTANEVGARWILSSRILNEHYVLRRARITEVSPT